MADERAIGEHVVPRITKAAAEVGRPAPRIVAGSPSPVLQRRGGRARATWANQLLGHAEYSPNYQRLLEHGDATDVGDILAAGDESAIVERLRSFRDAGVTDLSVRVLPFGPTATRGSSRASGPRRSSPRSVPSSERPHRRRTVQLHHVTLFVRDADRSIRFYRDGLGFTILIDREFDGDWPTLFGVESKRLRAVILGDPERPHQVELVTFAEPVPDGPPPSCSPRPEPRS